MQSGDERMGRLARLFLIYNTLASGESVRGAEMAARCGVTSRTLSRDLEVLREAGAQVSYNRASRGYVLERPLECHAVELGFDDLLALSLAQGAISAGSPHEGLARRAFSKLLGRLPRALREDAESARGAVGAATSARRDYSAAPWPDVMKAATRRETLSVLYHSLKSDTITWRDIDPYALTMPRGYWQIVGFCHQRREVLTFALDGVRALKATGKIFQIQKGFDLGRFLENSLGAMCGEPSEIVVRFDASIARWAQRRSWRFRHTLEAEGNDLLLRGTVSGLEEIKSELLSWGAHVEVLEPPELREQMRLAAQGMLERYEKKTE